MIQFLSDYGVWIAIYWLVMFYFTVLKQRRPEHWTVVMWVFLFSFFLPIMLVYFIVKKAREQAREK